MGLFNRKRKKEKKDKRNNEDDVSTADQSTNGTEVDTKAKNEETFSLSDKMIYDYFLMLLLSADHLLPASVPGATVSSRAKVVYLATVDEKMDNPCGCALWGSSYFGNRLVNLLNEDFPGTAFFIRCRSPALAYSDFKFVSQVVGVPNGTPEAVYRRLEKRLPVRGAAYPFVFFFEEVGPQAVQEPWFRRLLPPPEFADREPIFGLVAFAGCYREHAPLLGGCAVINFSPPTKSAFNKGEGSTVRVSPVTKKIIGEKYEESWSGEECYAQLGKKIEAMLVDNSINDDAKKVLEFLIFSKGGLPYTDCFQKLDLSEDQLTTAINLHLVTKEKGADNRVVVYLSLPVHQILSESNWLVNRKLDSGEISSLISKLNLVISVFNALVPEKKTTSQPQEGTMALLEPKRRLKFTLSHRIDCLGPMSLCFLSLLRLLMPSGNLISTELAGLDLGIPLTNALSIQLNLVGSAPPGIAVIVKKLLLYWEEKPNCQADCKNRCVQETLQLLMCKAIIPENNELQVYQNGAELFSKFNATIPDSYAKASPLQAFLLGRTVDPKHATVPSQCNLVDNAMKQLMAIDLKQSPDAAAVNCLRHHRNIRWKMLKMMCKETDVEIAEVKELLKEAEENVRTLAEISGARSTEKSFDGFVVDVSHAFEKSRVFSSHIDLVVQIHTELLCRRNPTDTGMDIRTLLKISDVSVAVKRQLMLSDSKNPLNMRDFCESLRYNALARARYFAVHVLEQARLVDLPRWLDDLMRTIDAHNMALAGFVVDSHTRVPTQLYADLLFLQFLRDAGWRRCEGKEDYYSSLELKQNELQRLLGARKGGVDLLVEDFSPQQLLRQYYSSLPNSIQEYARIDAEQYGSKKKSTVIFPAVIRYLYG